ncbi:NAD(P)/FAD-dependent oxidoreductase [uncultured Ramlibacter sp.]|uniref:FAD-dependent oxidoreductase n=1 Tax=uncultured Ramlibacter sp. TaxID=260755 RepID=UPI002637D23E|nr:NAD(P)/FAD-dependent oxidoreductase [uncultured Ramlibacter sp.]
MKIVILGAGVAGALLARRLARIPGIDVTCLERVQPDDHSEAGTGLNVGPNAVKALRLTDPALAAQVEAASLPWSRWTAALADGSVLFDLPIESVADNPGIRIRWSELYRVLRVGAGSAIRYGCDVTGVGRDPKAPGKTFVTWEEGGQVHRSEGIDLLVGADGRYSLARSALSGVPQPRHVGVAILRALVEDTSGGLVDDYGQWFNGAHRLLAFRVKPGHVYIAATFPLVPGAPVAPAWSTAPVMRATWEPASGRPRSATLQWLLDALCEQLPDSHWARMQESDVRYHETDANVLYLGDSAHGMVPTLGQGATQAMEDACAAALIIEDEIAQGQRPVAAWLERIARVRTPRVQFAMALSLQASDTLLAGADPVAGAHWKTQPPFLADLSRLFRDVALGKELAQELATP